MRILHLLNDVRDIGNGIINTAVDLSCEQQSAGHEVVVASAGGEFEPLLARYGVDLSMIEPSRSPLAVRRAAEQVIALTRATPFDVVHSHTHATSAMAWLATRRTPTGLVAHAHADFRRGAILVGLAGRVIAPSEPVASRLAARHIPRSKIRVVPNGTIGSPRHLQEVEPAPLEHPAIVTVAGLYERKGIDVLLEAFDLLGSKQGSPHLYLIGDGPDRSRFERQTASLSSADRIHFEGFRAHPEPYVKAADVFVLASRRDPDPLVISEARSHGCAIVASAVDGIPDACDQGRAGYLVTPGDVGALAAGMREVLSSPDSLKHWQEAAGRDLERLQISRVAADVERVYRELRPDA